MPRILRGSPPEQTNATVATRAQRTEPTEEQVRARAYEIFQARGGAPGRDLDDWVQAKRELTERPTVGTIQTRA